MYAVKQLPPIQWTGKKLIWNGQTIGSLAVEKRPFGYRIDWERNQIYRLRRNGRKPGRGFPIPSFSLIKKELLALYASAFGLDLDVLLKNCDYSVCKKKQKITLLYRDHILAEYYRCQWFCQSDGTVYYGGPSDSDSETEYIDGRFPIGSNHAPALDLLDSFVTRTLYYGYHGTVEQVAYTSEPSWPTKLQKNTFIRGPIRIRLGSRRLYIYWNGILAASCFLSKKRELHSGDPNTLKQRIRSLGPLHWIDDQIYVGFRPKIRLYDLPEWQFVCRVLHTDPNTLKQRIRSLGPLHWICDQIMLCYTRDSRGPVGPSGPRCPGTFSPLGADNLKESV